MKGNLFVYMIRHGGFITQARIHYGSSLEDELAIYFPFMIHLAIFLRYLSIDLQMYTVCTNTRQQKP